MQNLRSSPENAERIDSGCLKAKSLEAGLTPRGFLEQLEALVEEVSTTYSSLPERERVEQYRSLAGAVWREDEGTRTSQGLRSLLETYRSLQNGSEEEKTLARLVFASALITQTPRTYDGEILVSDLARLWNALVEGDPPGEEDPLAWWPAPVLRRSREEEELVRYFGKEPLKKLYQKFEPGFCRISPSSVVLP